MKIARCPVGDSAVLVVDVQERLLGAIPNANVLLDAIQFLLEGGKLLGVPAIATEQYPQGLGTTHASLTGLLPVDRPAKKAFSSYAVPDVVEWLDSLGRKHIILVGIETHVCVLQTALDLLTADFSVVIVVDAVASRQAIDRDTALHRLTHAGAMLTTTETLLFEWLGSADSPSFKAVSGLVKARDSRRASL